MTRIARVRFIGWLADVAGLVGSERACVTDLRHLSVLSDQRLSYQIR